MFHEIVDKVTSFISWICTGLAAAMSWVAAHNDYFVGISALIGALGHIYTIFLRRKKYREQSEKNNR